MVRWNWKSALQKAAFFIIVLLTFTPLLVYHAVSVHFHEIHNSPSVKMGAIDLAGYNFETGREIPLDGQWEFFYGRWICSEGEKPDKPDFLAAVPLPWNHYGLKEPLPQRGIASYRIRLENPPGGIPLTCYIPNISSSYAVYLNGELIAGRGGAAGCIQDSASYPCSAQVRKGILLPAGSEAELVIEIRSGHIGGLYMTPVLTNADRDYVKSALRYFIASAYIGILVLSIIIFALVLLSKNQSFQSLALLLLDILILIRILAMDEFFEILRSIVPIFRHYLINSVLQSLTLFLPVIFLFCTRQLFSLKINPKIIWGVTFYELFFSAAIFWCAMTGRPLLQQFLCVASYLPFFYILWRLYGNLRQGVPYTLTVSSILMQILSCIIGADLKASGMLVMNISLYAPTCFVLSMLLQMAMYMAKNREIQRQAMEADKLSLRLRESEMSLMMSQIKPHFLYNTLVAIHMLCTEEPEAAADAVMRFADYLRGNMRSINSREPIPFSKELEHIKNYVSIEQLRFQERLAVRYEIGTTDFRVPALTIQPLVENAIKHGACRNIGGGMVNLRTKETEDGCLVEVSDDGPGFDTKILREPRGDSYGLQNIILRLREQCAAEVSIQSAPGQGTVVRVCLPKGTSFPGLRGTEGAGK